MVQLPVEAFAGPHVRLGRRDTSLPFTLQCYHNGIASTAIATASTFTGSYGAPL